LKTEATTPADVMGAGSGGRELAATGRGMVAPQVGLGVTDCQIPLPFLLSKFFKPKPVTKFKTQNGAFPDLQNLRNISVR
jgi:hypothetical protein